MQQCCFAACTLEVDLLHIACVDAAAIEFSLSGMQVPGMHSKAIRFWTSNTILNSIQCVTQNI